MAPSVEWVTTSSRPRLFVGCAVVARGGWDTLSLRCWCGWSHEVKILINDPDNAQRAAREHESRPNLMTEVGAGNVDSFCNYIGWLERLGARLVDLFDSPELLVWCDAMMQAYPEKTARFEALVGIANGRAIPLCALEDPRSPC